MTKFTNILFGQKNSFIPRYGHNKAQKNGRKMEKNAPTLSSIIKSEEEKDAKKKRYKNNNSLNCQKQIDDLINCIKNNGKDQINLCEQNFNNLNNCYSNYYDQSLAFKVYNTQINLILKTF